MSLNNEKGNLGRYNIRGGFWHEAHILRGRVHVDCIYIKRAFSSENDFLFFIFDFAVFLREYDFMIFVTKLTETEKIVFQSFNVSNSPESCSSVGQSSKATSVAFTISAKGHWKTLFFLVVREDQIWFQSCVVSIHCPYTRCPYPEKQSKLSFLWYPFWFGSRDVSR